MMFFLFIFLCCITEVVPEHVADVCVETSDSFYIIDHKECSYGRRCDEVLECRLCSREDYNLVCLECYSHNKDRFVHNKYFQVLQVFPCEDVWKYSKRYSVMSNDLKIYVEHNEMRGTCYTMAIRLAVWHKLMIPRHNYTLQTTTASFLQQSHYFSTRKTTVKPEYFFTRKPEVTSTPFSNIPEEKSTKTTPRSKPYTTTEQNTTPTLPDIGSTTSKSTQTKLPNNHIFKPDGQTFQTMSPAKDNAELSHKTFTLKMMKAFVKTYPNYNIIFSPVSIMTILKVMEAGASTDTKRKITELLGPSYKLQNIQYSSAGIVADTATAIFYNENLSFKNNFKQVVKRNNVSLEAMDFRGKSRFVADSINNWVSNNTRGQIAQIINAGSVRSITDMLLVNTVYFKGKWEQAFDPNRTVAAEFHDLDGTSVPAYLMRSADKTNFKAGYFPEHRLTMVELSYLNSSLCMQIYLPDNDSSLTEVEKTLTAEKMQHIENDILYTEVDLYLPRIRYEFKADLKHPFNEMGLGDITSSLPEVFTDGIVRGLDKIQHWSVVDVVEEGTTAASATAVIVSLSIFPSLEMRVDRPFLFFIQDKKTKQYLFAARVTY